MLQKLSQFSAARTECLERLLALPPEELAFKSFPDLFQDEDRGTKAKWPPKHPK